MTILSPLVRGFELRLLNLIGQTLTVNLKPSGQLRYK